MTDAIKEAVLCQSSEKVTASDEDVKTIQRYQETGLDLASSVALFLTQQMVENFGRSTTPSSDT